MLKKLTICFIVGVVFVGCASNDIKSRKYARATLDSRSLSNVRGVVDFVQVGNEVLLTGYFSGLEPDSEYGFHIHEKGDCTAQDASSAGGHFNPRLHSHGAPGGENSHAGDLPNIASDMNGNAIYTASISGVSLDNSPNGILDKSAIVHHDADDYVSQPAGNSGARIACGIIKR